jgi:hypothetical protein
LKLVITAVIVLASLGVVSATGVYFGRGMLRRGDTGTVVRVPIQVTGGGTTPPPTPTATTITGAAPGVTYGQAASVTATVSPAAATGQVVLLNGTTVIGQANLSGGKATIAVPAKLLPPGSYTLTLRYAGNASYAASSTTVAHTVSKVVPVMTVKAPKKIDKGDKAKVKVLLSAADGVPVTGTVTVTIKGGKTLTGTVENGKVVFKLPKAKETGELKLKVVYSGSNLVEKVKDRLSIKVV